MKKKFELSYAWLMTIILTVALAPGAYLLYRYFSGHVTADPVQDMTQHSGKYALIFLMASLSMTPLKTITGWRWTMTARKWLGLAAFFYTVAHLFIYIGLDYGFAWEYIIPEVLEKRYLIVGVLAFVILLLLAATSFQWWINVLGRGWTRLHSLIYAAGVLVVLHYAWVNKGDIFALRGDVIEPLIYGGIYILLMVLRLPFVRKPIEKLRKQRRRHSAGTQTVVVRRVQHADHGGQGD